MCLGIPGKLSRWLDHDPTFGRAEIEFEGVRRVCHMACVPDAVEGDYVVVHAGIAISRIDAGEAERLLEELRYAGLEPELPGASPEGSAAAAPAVAEQPDPEAPAGASGDGVGS